MDGLNLSEMDIKVFISAPIFNLQANLCTFHKYRNNIFRESGNEKFMI